MSPTVVTHPPGACVKHRQEPAGCRAACTAIKIKVSEEMEEVWADIHIGAVCDGERLGPPVWLGVDPAELPWDMIWAKGIADTLPDTHDAIRAMCHCHSLHQHENW